MGGGNLGINERFWYRLWLRGKARRIGGVVLRRQIKGIPRGGMTSANRDLYVFVGASRKAAQTLVGVGEVVVMTDSKMTERDARDSQL